MEYKNEARDIVYSNSLFRVAPSRLILWGVVQCRAVLASRTPDSHSLLYRYNDIGSKEEI